ncbi:MAG: hypothetical protein LAT55_13610 [Opitutales bacterium]|nr:hypothetical protein [Opitutales bacterium]
MAKPNPFNPSELLPDFVTQAQLNSVKEISESSGSIEIAASDAPWQILNLDDTTALIVNSFSRKARSVLLTITLTGSPTIDFDPNEDVIFLTEVPDLSTAEVVQILYSSPDEGSTVYAQVTGIKEAE